MRKPKVEYTGPEGRPASPKERRAAAEARKALMERRDMSFAQKECLRNGDQSEALRRILEMAATEPAKPARRTSKKAPRPQPARPVEKTVRRAGLSPVAAEYVISG